MSLRNGGLKKYKNIKAGEYLRFSHAPGITRANKQDLMQ